ncbi:uncharacterized protein wu:fc75a09 [Pseudorasbora parva]|uniref:uncharacterized protein wu:fc75a09 n=1 Tax=Pseudorasbora parva TaxID=51549 RepID=UPI00351DF82C
MVHTKKTMPDKITTIFDLQECGFGQPWPRHGLKLLYWFANECIWVNDDDDMFLACDPAKKVFGFHRFENRCFKPNEKLLPDVGFHYYLLGNLNSPGADMLPKYVKEHNNGRHYENNADRIIVTDHGQMRFGEIYLTTHKDLSRFDPNATFHISRSLLKIIQSYPNLEDFLQTVGYQVNTCLVHIPLMMCQVEVKPDDKKATSEKRSAVSVDTDIPSRNCVCSCTIL